MFGFKDKTIVIHSITINDKIYHSVFLKIFLLLLSNSIDNKSNRNKDYLTKLRRIHLVFYKRFHNLRHESVCVGREKLNKNHNKSSFFNHFALILWVILNPYFTLLVHKADTTDEHISHINTNR